MDIFLFQTIDDGEINVENGIIEMSGGLDTAAYLSLFGGNEDCSGRETCPFSWWGNFSEIDKANQYISETQYLLKTLPITTGNLPRIKDAATRDLNWFLDKKIASSVIVTVSIPALNTVKINVRIEAQGLESSFEFVENWKAMLNPITDLGGSIAVDLYPFKNLVSCDFGANRIYVHDGVSGSTIDDFASPAGDPLGLTFDGTNLISCDDGTNLIYIHDGVLPTILSSFAAPANNPFGLAFDGTNLISCDYITDTIYIHDGISSTILSSFASPDINPSGLTVANGNLISCDSDNDLIYIHDGISETTLDNFASPFTQPQGLAFDGTNLISCDTNTNLIYIHDGISEDLLDSFASPSSNASGLTMVL